MRVNIIGGGLAGCALAYILKQKSAEPVIYEASAGLASGASGNDVGLYNPRFTAEFDAIGQFYARGFDEAYQLFETCGEQIDWNPCGALHLMNDEKKARRFVKTVKNWVWAEEDMHIVDAVQASEVAGVDISSDCLYLRKSGKISPKKLCTYYARGVEVRLNAPIHDIYALDGDAVVLACGIGVKNFKEAAHLPLKPVRGQVSYIQQTEKSVNLRCALGYGGYIAPAENGVHCVGSTFQRWLDHSNIIEEDDALNIRNLSENIPSLHDAYSVVNRRAAVRTTSADHVPVVGEVVENVYVSTAHGSHGILSSLLSAIILSDIVTGSRGAVSSEVLKLVSSDRFSDVPR